MFDIIRMRLPGTLFLDLYAGTGLVGLEALSNGARRAIFVEREKSSIRLIERNVADAGFAEQAEVRLGDATKPLHWLADEKCDFIFMGPPYKDPVTKRPLALTVPTLARIEEAGLLAATGWVLAQHHDKEPVDRFPASWEMFRRNKYGDSFLSFFRKKV
jgi:16S rRNA (guanine966-N2)-methyltransferase